jgi:hypothetical protein
MRFLVKDVWRGIIFLVLPFFVTHFLISVFGEKSAGFMIDGRSLGKMIGHTGTYITFAH